MGYKYIFLIVLMCWNFSTNAQTGIGTNTPNASAKLDVSSNNMGFLPPRVALTAANAFSPITGTSSAAAGLLVYNTATAGAAPNNVVPGYYYWNGTSWIQISGGLVIDNSRSVSFNLASADNNKVFLITSSTAVTVTVPSTLPIGFSCQIIQGGAGTLSFVGSGVTLNSANGLTTRTTNSVIGLVMNSASTGFVFGDSIF